MGFEIGKRVMGIKSGKCGVIVDKCDDSLEVENDDGTVTSCEGHPDRYYKLITCAEQNKAPGKDMSLISKLLLSLKSEPEKSFIKVGVANPDGTFTCEGKELFLNWLVQDKATADRFNAEVVQPLLAQMKEDKDCGK